MIKFTYSVSNHLLHLHRGEQTKDSRSIKQTMNNIKLRTVELH